MSISYLDFVFHDRIDRENETNEVKNGRYSMDTTIQKLFKGVGEIDRCHSLK
jgi:hypothetical protein